MNGRAEKITWAVIAILITLLGYWGSGLETRTGATEKSVGALERRAARDDERWDEVLRRLTGIEHALQRGR